MKVWMYIFIMTGLMFFLHFAGLPSSTTPVINAFGIGFGQNRTIESVSFTNSDFYNQFFASNGILAIAVTAGIVVGFLTKQSSENFILAGVIVFIATMFVGTFINLIIYAVSLGDTFVSTLIFLIFFPFTVGFAFALAEWFRGTD